MITKIRATDKTSTKYFFRSERILTDGAEFFYKTREGGMSVAFSTRSEALYDLNNFIVASSLEAEFMNESFTTGTYC